MSFEGLGQGALDYLPCRYGTSKLLFRGPRRSLSEPYVAFLGGTDTYGKFIADPYPSLVEQNLGRMCLNLGCVNAGVDVFLNDPYVPEMTSKADLTVIQVLGAQNMSNRFYSVHPRRNDRLVKASTLLQAIYREVDFAEFNFTRHMLQRLLTLSPGRFETVVEELQQAWTARMKNLIKATDGKVVLLWLSDRASDAPLSLEHDRDPLFVNREMLHSLSDLVDDIIEVQASEAAIAEGTQGMVFNEMETPAAQHQLGPAIHEEAAAVVTEKLRKHL